MGLQVESGTGRSIFDSAISAFLYALTYMEINNTTSSIVMTSAVVDHMSLHASTSAGRRRSSATASRPDMVLASGQDRSKSPLLYTYRRASPSTNVLSEDPDSGLEPERNGYDQQQQRALPIIIRTCHPPTPPLLHDRQRSAPVPYGKIFPLCLARISEGMIYSVILPYINEMIRGFGVEEEKVGVWSAMAVSCFYTESEVICTWRQRRV